MVTLMPMLMLSMTASTDASTPVAPFIPQNPGHWLLVYRAH